LLPRMRALYNFSTIRSSCAIIATSTLRSKERLGRCNTMLEMHSIVTTSRLRSSTGLESTSLPSKPPCFAIFRAISTPSALRGIQIPNETDLEVHRQSTGHGQPEHREENVSNVLNVTDTSFELTADQESLKSRCDFFLNVQAAVTLAGGYVPPRGDVPNTLNVTNPNPSGNYSTPSSVGNSHGSWT
jgi:hypothetical protein